jgi:prepilin-type N-terminal cleavage/methylation domain-containing protein
MRLHRSREQLKAAFTLVEVAVTILIVGIALTLVLQSLNTSKLRAKQTQHLKIANELGSLTMGRVSAGLYREEVDTYISGSYSEEGYPEFTFEATFGDTPFPSSDVDEPGARFDNWYDEDDQYDDDEDEEETEPYEKVKIRITFPVLSEYSNQIEMERWIPWDQVYEEEEGEGDPLGEAPR